MAITKDMADKSNVVWKYTTPKARFFIVMYFITRIMFLVNTVLYALFTIRFVMGYPTSLKFLILLFIATTISFAMSTLTQNTIRIV